MRPEDIIMMQPEINATTAFLAFDRAKHFTVSDVFGDCEQMAIGKLWMEYAQDIVDFIQANGEKPSSLIVALALSSGNKAKTMLAGGNTVVIHQVFVPEEGEYTYMLSHIENGIMFECTDCTMSEIRTHYERICERTNTLNAGFDQPLWYSV